MPFWQGLVERSADILMHETTVPTSFELLTATSARLGGSLNRNIKIKYSWSVQICPQGSSLTGYLPQLQMAQSAVLSERRVDSRTRANQFVCFIEGAIRPGKALQHRQHIPRRVQICTRFEPQPGAGKEERCGAFAGSPQQCQIQLNVLLISPSSIFVAEHVGNSERIIHSYLTKESHEIALFRRELLPRYVGEPRRAYCSHCAQQHSMCDRFNYALEPVFGPLALLRVPCMTH
jgi:hypothetical protein